MKSMDWYVNNDDLEGAINRFNTTSQNWKKRWFETICLIYDNSKKWVTKYVIDKVNQTVKKVVDNVKQKVNKCKTEGRKGYVYLLRMFNAFKDWLYNKVGKSSGNGNFNKRMYSLRKEKYLGGNGDIEVVKLYELPDEDSALILESYIRRYFRTKYDYVPNDRFTPFTFTDEDLQECDRLYNLTLSSI